MIMTIPGNFKKISFQWEEFPTTSSIMIIHFCFILQKGREKNYIVFFFYSGKNNSNFKWQLLKFSYHKKYRIHNMGKKFLSNSKTSRFLYFEWQSSSLSLIIYEKFQMAVFFASIKKITFVGDKKKIAILKSVRRALGGVEQCSAVCFEKNGGRLKQMGPH